MYLSLAGVSDLDLSVAKYFQKRSLFGDLSLNFQSIGNFQQGRSLLKKIIMLDRRNRKENRLPWLFSLGRYKSLMTGSVTDWAVRTF
jgi:hypothetical protein